jgi:hypothetical protein
MKRLFVRDLRGPFDDGTFAALAPDARIQWRAPLASEDLERALGWLRAHPAAALRLSGGAVEQIDAVAKIFAPCALTLDATRLPARLVSLPTVTDLTLEGAPADAASVLAAMPALQTLEVNFRGADFELSALARVPKLQRLSLVKTCARGSPPSPRLARLQAIELREVRAEHIDDFLRLPSMRALRLCAVQRLRSIDALEGHPNLRVLALESLPHLESIGVLATLPQLVSLDIAGLWQFAVADAAFIASLCGLRRLAIDIGGRRKNVEISKRLQLRRPDPFDVRAVTYDFTTS